ncbi:hypothetical protein GGQ88_002151 [Novosphingobium hassiacum]|uniref:Uncharacterized protein n=1 Tax=Novosphingobium hassiacum TaxID=173676 RepID=A0A7W6EW04_9SPHN|nr:hypothetical protein [Novosphingobium hassiacum]
MLRVARLDVGLFQLLEQGSLLAIFVRPNVGQTTIEPFCLCSQKTEVVDVWRLCRPADYVELAQGSAVLQQHARNGRGIVSRSRATSNCR